MKEKIGLPSIILLGVNAIIGSGIFLLPGEIMALVGKWSFAVYFLVTCIVLMIAWCFAKCAALFSRNGGAYVYAKEAFGPFIGFEIGLMRWIVSMISWATLVVGFVTAVSAIWPIVFQEPYRSLLILGMIGLLTVLNILGMSWIKYLNNTITLAKLVPLLIFIGVGVFYLQPFESIPTQVFHSDSFGAATLLIFYAFCGFENLVVVAGEMENPRKNLPKAIMIIVGFSSMTYLIVQTISMGILGAELANSVTPISDAAGIVLGSWGKWIVGVAMLISIAGINVSTSFVVPRGGEALAEDGLLPRWMAYRGRFDTPVWAIMFCGLVTLVIALTGDFIYLASTSVVARLVQYVSTCTATLVLYPRLKWPQKMIPILSLCAIAWMFTHASVSQLLIGIGAMVLIVPLYKFRTQEALQMVVVPLDK